MELKNLKLKCECDGRMEKITTTWKGVKVGGWRCIKCREELIHPEDAQKTLEIEETRKLNAKI